MKLMQLNIWQGKLLITVSRFLKEQNADFVCLQEVFSSESFIGVLDNISSLETLQKDLGYPYVYYEPALSFETGGVTAKIGNAILSKHPLSNQKVIFTNNEFHHVSHWPDDFTNTRNLQMATVTLPDGKTFTLANHHGMIGPDSHGTEQTTLAMQKAADALKKTEGPLVFTGDLNVESTSTTLEVFKGWLTDLTDVYKITDTLSQFGKVRNVPCDHILVSDDVRVTHFAVSDVLVSDHKPLILEFEI